ncbi:MAG: tRNA (guanine(46)-N(7))-methyltransferase TrmB [Shimia sp.]
MDPPDKHPSAPWRNFYGRLKGKQLKPAQQRDLDEVLPEVRLAGVGWDENPGRTPLELPDETWLEVGFGGGEHLAALAAAHPRVTFLACEPYLNGVAMLLGKIRRAGLANIRVHPGDARDLLDVVPPGALGRAYLLYPDPWPKARHHRRRFVTPEHLGPLARAMAPGAELRVATDIPDYVRQTLEEVPRAGFVWTAESAADWRAPWDGWVRTRYEAKALREGRTPHYMRFRRDG